MMRDVFPDRRLATRTPATPNKNKTRLLGLCLGLFLFSVYLFTYRGGFHSIDEVSMFAVTESLVKFGRFDTNQVAWTQWTTSQAEAQGFFGQTGHVYSKKGLALSLAQAPLYWLALHLPRLGMLQTASLLNALLTAATGMLVFMFLQRLLFSTQTALLTALIFGLATLSFVYAKYLFSEPLAGLLLLLATYMLVVYRLEGGLHHVAIAGVAAGLAVLARANNLFLLPVFGLYLLWIAMQRDSAEAKPRPWPVTPSRSQFTIHYSPFTIHPLPLLVFILTVAGAGLLLMAYNALRSGNPWQTGYDLTLFSPNLLLGLYKLLFSPLRGLFVYSPILLLSLAGWWQFRRAYPAEAWLVAGLTGLTIFLFSAWSSGEGLSWGSRFLVPVVPFLALTLAPIVERVAGRKSQAAGSQVASRTSAKPPRETLHSSRFTLHASRFTFYLLLLLSFIIQLLGVIINPWVYLAQLQAEFGGEFFLENTAALYDFRYSQIAGQWQTWSPENVDLAWLRWGFDPVGFGLSLGLILLTGWLLWNLQAGERGSSPSRRLRAGAEERRSLPLYPFPPVPWLVSSLIVTVLITYILLARYYQTDRQFGPANDVYTQALTAVAQNYPGDQIVTVAQNHYHVPMNRFKARAPILGMAQQDWPLPGTALPLLQQLTSANIWLITVGFSPAAPNNATEQWLSLTHFKVSDEWLDDGVRRVRYSTVRPTLTRPIKVTLGKAITLAEVRLATSLQPGQTLPVEFTWQPAGRPQVNYNLFLQLLNSAGAPVAQHDSPPNGGYTPTGLWPPDQPVTTRHALAIPNDVTGGDYRLIAGLYDPTTGVRLFTETGHDFVELGNVTIIGVEPEARRRE